MPGRCTKKHKPTAFYRHLILDPIQQTVEYTPIGSADSASHSPPPGVTNMTRTAAPVCSHEVTETVLTLTNWGHLYSNTIKPVLANLADKIARGKYDAALAAKAFRNVVETGMRDPEWSVVYGTWRPSVTSRNAAAAQMLDSYKEELRELAAEAIGPEYLAVDVCNFAHDVYGNPTAQHHIYTSTEDGGRVRLLNDRKVRRAQVGYGDYTDGVREALSKNGIRPEHYERTGKDGNRSSDSIVVTFKRRAITV